MLKRNEIQEAAWHLVLTSPFKELWPSRTYRLFSAVPVWEIQFDDAPIGKASSDPEEPAPVVDVLICRGCEIRLAVFFGEPDWRREKWFGAKGILHGMQSIWIPAPNTKELMAQVGKTVYEPLQAEDRKARRHRPRFSLDVGPVECMLPPNAKMVLTDNGLLSEKGAVTDKGFRWGLYADVSDGVPEAVLSEWAARKLLDTLFPPPEDGNLTDSFAGRLQRIRAGIPADARFVQQTLKEMQQLLGLPLSEFFRMNTEIPARAAYARFQKAAAEAGKLLVACCDAGAKPPETFSDAIHLSRMLKEYAEHSDEAERAEEVNKEILAALCDAITFQRGYARRGSLHQRLHTCENSVHPIYRVLTLPIEQYIYCACILCRSYEPDWMFRTCLIRYLNPLKRGEHYSVVRILRQARTNLRWADQVAHSEGACMIYYGLVYPLAADCKTEREEPQ